MSICNQMVINSIKGRLEGYLSVHNRTIDPPAGASAGAQEGLSQVVTPTKRGGFFSQISLFSSNDALYAKREGFSRQLIALIEGCDNTEKFVGLIDVLIREAVTASIRHQNRITRHASPSSYAKVLTDVIAELCLVYRYSQSPMVVSELQNNHLEVCVEHNKSLLEEEIESAQAAIDSADKEYANLVIGLRYNDECAQGYNIFDGYDLKADEEGKRKRDARVKESNIAIDIAHLMKGTYDSTFSDLLAEISGTYTQAYFDNSPG